MIVRITTEYKGREISRDYSITEYWDKQRAGEILLDMIETLKNTEEKF